MYRRITRNTKSGKVVVWRCANRVEYGNRICRNSITVSNTEIESAITEKLLLYQYGESLVGMYLYGSYARGDFDSESDVDYVAIVHGDRLSLQKELNKVREVSFKIGLDNDIIVSPTVIPFDEFEKYKEILPYYKNVEKEGISIE